MPSRWPRRLVLGDFTVEKSCRRRCCGPRDCSRYRRNTALPFFKTVGAIHRGRCLAMEGRAAEGIAQMTEGLAAFRSTGAVGPLPRLLTRIAEAYGRAWQPLEGLEHLTEAIHII